MSHGKIREDKTCLNCGHTVEERFCPHCGQENIEPKQPFHYLFTHFIEDFTHYDGQFWKTIKYLLFNPGKLTKEYLAGKRQLYVAPVKLYIFISFITFLVPALIPKAHESEKAEKISHIERTEKIEEQKEATNKILDEFQKKGLFSKETVSNAKKIADSIQIKDSVQEKSVLNDGDVFEKTFSDNTTFMDAHNLKEYDSLYAKDEGFFHTLSRPMAKKVFELKESGFTKAQIKEKYIETILHTIPKALFVYLPIFAFFLWIFHNKKRWWYFDHGIFTLHYFSFLLLSTLIYIVINRIGNLLPDYTIFTLLFSLINVALFFYISLYFFIAHYRTYESKKRVSIVKGSILFIINFIGLLIMLIILMYISLIMLH
ncbi:DUF3667 domain-containing protein [Chryseobacterium ginsengisoli]|uniref:DUF3667 domain-containing protein n=1 Tax=Chryseobacterium ginsengisoli TaxID=363853 RepID=A0ABP9MTF6_9FLAO